MTHSFTDRAYLQRKQYASDANLAARQAIYRYQQPRVNVATWALDLVQLSGSERILDIGAGNGRYEDALAQRRHHGPVYAVDLSAGMLRAAARRVSCAMVVADAQRLPFAKASFDVALAMHMLYHVPDRSAAFDELRRVVRPGGAVVAVTNARDHLDALHALVGNADRAYMGFDCEHAAVELESHFGTVDHHELKADLVVTDPEPVVAYVRSMGAFMDGSVDIGERVAAVIAREGALRITTHVCCFVARI